MYRKPLLGIVGVSDGDPEVHETLKDVVREQLDTIVAGVRIINGYFLSIQLLNIQYYIEYTQN